MNIARELRIALRSLRNTPIVSALAIACIALGIGATTAISAAINRALLQRPAFANPDELVAVFRTTPQSGPQGTWPHSPANYLDLAARTKTLSGLAAFSQGTALVGLPNESVRASRVRVSGNLFQLLGVVPSRGRLLTPADDEPSEPPVAVMSYEFWQSQFGGDSSIIGQSTLIDGAPTTIAGIAPRQFRVAIGPQLLRADLWLTLRWTPAQRGVRGSNSLLMVGRLAPQATAAAADRELRAVFDGIVREHPELRGESVRVGGLQREGSLTVRQPLLLLLGGVVAVLLIASTNVASLLLARAVQRRRELAVRTALGATRWDAMRPLLLESLILSLAGALIGLVIAAAGVRTIGLLAAARLPQLTGLSIDRATIALAILLAFAVAMLCGCVPAWRSGSVDPQDALSGGRGGGTGRRQQRALRGLVMIEVGLSLMLLIGGTLVLRGFRGLLTGEPGFETAHVMTFNVTIAAERYANRSTVRTFLEPVLEQVEAIPGVEHAGAISSVPYASWGNNSNVRYEGQPNTDPTRFPLAEYRQVTPSWFGTTGQRLIAGRLLTGSDDERTAPVVVVNQALVKRDLQGRDPIGARFHLSDTTYATIVGVVSDIRNVGPFAPPFPEMYWPYRQDGGSSGFSLLVRTRGSDPLAVAGAIRAAVHGVDGTAAVSGMSSMDEVIARSLGSPRFYFSLIATFAVVALVLALSGLYGVLTYVVTQRTREMGIRSALGSPPRAIVGLVTGDGARLLAGGLVIGTLGGLAATRFMTFMLYGVSPLDARSWIVAFGLMTACGLLAAIVPAVRATRVDPIIALRAE